MPINKTTLSNKFETEDPRIATITSMYDTAETFAIATVTDAARDIIQANPQVTEFVQDKYQHWWIINGNRYCHDQIMLYRMHPELPIESVNALADFEELYAWFCDMFRFLEPIKVNAQGVVSEEG
jgi:hypothetical protein